MFTAMSHKVIVERVQTVFARATRYPLEVLTEDANLDDELGIDSVKMVEIFACIREEFGIGAERVFKRDEVKTIGSIARLLETPAAAGKAPTPPAHAQADVGRIAAPSPAASGPASAPAVVRHEPPAVVTAVAAPAYAPIVFPRRDTRPTGTLTDKIVLVTGSGRGLGRTIATELAAQGATVIVNSFHSREAGDATCADIVQAGGRAIHVWGSVANEAHVTRMFEEIGQRFRRLDALVANASDGFIGPFEALSAAHWERGFKTNVIGLHQCAVAAAKLMSGGGQIITMSTTASSRTLRDFTCQGVLKSAVESLSRYLAVELAPQGIRVNCISAGAVQGELLHRFPNAEARIANWISLTPAGELIEPGEVAKLAAFLITNTLRSTTGSVITVDGGMSLSIDGDVSQPSPKPGFSLVG
jgi:NAD(P)-dependent dehydrogenase (short-subunit alcohol dehydrogenase family)/acyl carrier protein